MTFVVITNRLKNVPLKIVIRPRPTSGIWRGISYYKTHILIELETLIPKHSRNLGKN